MAQKCWSHIKSSKLLFCMLRFYLLQNLHNTCRSQPSKDIKLPQIPTNLNSIFQVLNMEVCQVLCLQCSISENLKNAFHDDVARHCRSPPIRAIYHSSVFLPCITVSSSLWAWFSFGTIRYNLSLATQFHISSQILRSKLLFDVGRVVDQGPCACRWQEVHNLFNCQVGMLRVHFIDPKLEVLHHVLSCFIINCYLFHFFNAHLVLLQPFIPPAIAMSFPQFLLYVFAGGKRYFFKSTVSYIPLIRGSEGTKSVIIVLLFKFVVIK
jgi:hypothetical protein